MCKHNFVEDTVGSTRLVGGELLEDIGTVVYCSKCGMDYDDWEKEIIIQAAESGADREDCFNLDDYIDRQLALLEEPRIEWLSETKSRIEWLPEQKSRIVWLDEIPF